MRNYIILNGNNSNEITGLLIQSLPPISKPLMRTAIEEIDGRDGDIVTTLGYSAYDKEVSIGLYGSYDVDAVIKYFSDNSKGQVTFSNEPDKYYNYEIINQIDFERLIRFKTAIVTLHCQPFKYPTDETPVEIAYQYVNNEAEEMALDNTADAPMQLDLKGNTSQDSTTGKNLFNNQGFPSAKFGGNSNATITFEDGTITSNTNYFSWAARCCELQLEKNVNYVLSGKLTSYVDRRTSNNSIAVIEVNGYTDSKVRIGSLIITNTGDFSYTFNSGDYDYIGIGFNGSKDGSIDMAGNVVFENVQLEKGSSATDYEKFTNGATPRPDYEQPIHIVSGDNTIEICGKNLFDVNAFENQLVTGKIINNNGVEVSDGTSTYSKYKIFLKANTAYHLKGAWQSIYYYDENDNFKSKSPGFNGADRTYTPTENEYIRLQISNSYWASNKGQEQIELGSTASTYEPYTGQSQLISLGVENLFDKDITPENYVYDNSGVKVSTNDPCINQEINNTNFTSIYISFASKTGNPYVRVCEYNSSGTFIKRTLVSTNQALTLDSNTRKLIFSVNASSTNNFTDLMIEKGTKKNSYTPYGTTPIELCKIGTYQDYIRKSTGKNLFDKDSVVGGFLNADGTVGGDTNAYKTSNFIPVQPNTAYYKTLTDSPRTKFYNANKQVLDSSTYQDVSIGGSAGTFTTPNNAYYFRFSYPIASVNANTTMVNKGTTSSPYEPYGKIWYLHKEIGKVVLDGSENWGQFNIENTGLGRALTRVDNVFYISNVPSVRSNKLIGTKYVPSWTLPYECVSSASNNRFIVYLKDVADLTSFKNKLSSGYDFYYVLATPTNTEITDTTLLEQLNNLEQAKSYDGTTHITQNANDKPFILNATALQKGSDTGIVDNDGNIYSKPTLDIEGNGIVGIYLNGNQMFSVDLSNSNECVIDVTNLEAYDPETNELMNRQVTGDYSKFILPVGENQVKVSGNVTKATISGYTRWL